MNIGKISPAGWLWTALSRAVWGALAGLVRAEADMRRLAEMSDSMLRDIGLDPAPAPAAKPAWPL